MSRRFGTVLFMSGMFVMSCATIPGIEYKFESCVLHRARTSNEVKISIEAARLAGPESKDETLFLPLSLFVPIAEFDSADQCVGCGMSVRSEMLCDGKTRCILVSASEMFTKTFPQSAPSLDDVNSRAATAGNAVNQTGGQAKLKGPSLPPLFLFTCESLAIIFSSEHVKMKEITVRVLKIIRHTFRSTTYGKKFRFRFTMQYQ